MPNFKGFFLGDFISERMRFSTTLGSSSFSEYHMPSFAPVYSCIRLSLCCRGWIRQDIQQLMVSIPLRPSLENLAIRCNIPRFYQILGEIFAFFLLEMIGNSQGFKTFRVYLKALLENYFKLSIIFLKKFF
jgi:hypothetical protein